MKLDKAEIKKLAPLGGIVLVLVIVMLYARRNVSGGAGAELDAGGQYVSTPGGGDGGAAAAANAQLDMAEMSARAEAFGGLLDYNLGIEKLHSDQATVFGLADRENEQLFGLAERESERVFGLADRAAPLLAREMEIGRELQVDLQGREHIQNMAAIQYQYQLGQGKINAEKSIAKHNIFANLGGNVLRAFAGFL